MLTLVPPPLTRAGRGPPASRRKRHLPLTPRRCQPRRLQRPHVMGDEVLRAVSSPTRDRTRKARPPPRAPRRSEGASGRRGPSGAAHRLRASRSPATCARVERARASGASPLIHDPFVLTHQDPSAGLRALAFSLIRVVVSRASLVCSRLWRWGSFLFRRSGRRRVFVGAVSASQFRAGLSGGQKARGACRGRSGRRLVGALKGSWRERMCQEAIRILRATAALAGFLPARAAMSL